MRYITFDAAGNTTGAYMQDPHPAHAGVYIEATPAQYARWTELQVVSGTLVDKPADVAPAPVVPAAVPMASARKALLRAGITDSLLRAAIADSVALTAAEKEEALIDLEFQAFVRRGAPLVVMLAPLFNLSEAQIDTLFIAAEAL